MRISNDIAAAIEILTAGGLVAFPTETVYGLGADATNDIAVEKVFIAKGRPADHPLIVHISDMAQLSDWARDISPMALDLAHCFWPGPLTLILKKASHVSDLITGHQDTIGVRMPNHPLTHALLQKFGKGMVGPSANRFGKISPTTAQAVHEELGSRVDLILDGGQCAVGLESTIINMSDDVPVILRPGMISVAELQNVLTTPLMARTQQGTLRVSGDFASHYAPFTATYLIDPAQLDAYLANLSTNSMPVAVMGFAQNKLLATKNLTYHVMPNDPVLYARQLYFTLRELDKQNFHQIIITNIPATPEWVAISNRLQRAAVPVLGCGQ
jgi:L-threonylcarbamoyladenylate synthase